MDQGDRWENLGAVLRQQKYKLAAWMNSGLGVEEAFQSGLEDTEAKPTRARIAKRPWEGRGIPGKP